MLFLLLLPLVSGWCQCDEMGSHRIGHLSMPPTLYTADVVPQLCYYITDICYGRYKEQYFKQTTNGPFTVEAADWFIFHSPFSKLVQKGFARLMLNDFVSRDFLESKTPSLWNGLDTFKYTTAIISSCIVCASFQG